MNTKTGKARAPATHKVFSDGGKRVAFYCDLSGMLVYTVNILTDETATAKTPEEELQTAWEEAKQHFNFCPKCGRNVCNEMFNADKCECVDCSPWLNQPVFCTVCGTKLMGENNYCVRCGTLIPKEGVDDNAEISVRHTAK